MVNQVSTYVRFLTVLLTALSSYHCAYFQLPEDRNENDQLMEEDAADIAARRKAEAKAREEAKLRQRTQVLSHCLVSSSRTCITSLPRNDHSACYLPCGIADMADMTQRRHASITLCACIKEPVPRYPCRGERPMVTQVLQRGLPRPLSLDHAPEARSAEGLSQKEAAEALLFAEMRALLQHDAAKYPVKETKKDKKVSHLPGQPRTLFTTRFIIVLCPFSCLTIVL